MNTLYLVRHGENPANLTLEFASRNIDYSLTPKGILQAQQTAERFRGEKIDAIYASPLKRASETAQIIAALHNMPVQIVENFREIEVGDLEGRPVSDENWALHNRILLDWIAGRHDSAFPNGDSYNSLWRRFSEGLRQIADDKENCKIMVVAHGGIFSATFKDLCPQDDPQIPFITFSANCSVTEINLEIVNGQPRGRLVRWGAFDHLSGEAAQLAKGVPEGELYRR